METLLDTAPCGFLSFTDDGVVREANATLLELLGYELADIVGQHVERIMPVGTRIFYQTHWFPLLRLHGHAEEVFLMLRTSSGEDVGMLTYAKRRADGGPLDCVLVPVRERAKYEHELLRAKKAAEEANQVAEAANRAKSEFLALMSHELRTPLNAIGGYLQILEMQIPGPLTDAQKDIVERIDKSGQHLLTLIEGVLDLSRIEAGVVEYALHDFSVGEIVDHVIPIVEQLVVSKGLQFNIEVDRALKLYADVDKVRQILINLLGNAVKFTQEGVVTLRSYRSGGEIRFEISDTGAGIPQDKQEAVFQPFIQVDSSRTRSEKGSGLGLTISRNFARGMGGDITLTSTPGQGSTFTLTMPAAAL